VIPNSPTIETFFTAYAANDRDGIASVLAEEIEWTIPATIPVRTKRGIDEVLAFFAALDSVGFKAETFFLQAGDDYVVDIRCGYATGGDGKVDRVVNLSGDQHQVDAFFWAIFPLKPLPKRLVG
jgi:uncharacterized protein